jgi:pyrroline-5-carboxylate reductase
MKMNLALIGGGIMGEAILSCILARKLASAEDIRVNDIDTNRLNTLSQQYAVHVLKDNRAAIREADVIILAVKPQSLDEVMADLASQLNQQLLLSIVAGASLSVLCQGFSHRQVVRAMPNVAAQIGEGISLWTATRHVGKRQRAWVSSILGALGSEIYVEEEKFIDMATAVSGSGPAYILLVIEAIIDAAVHIGLPRTLAQELTLQTVLGTAGLVKVTGRHPAELRNAVTSPGGTTAEALLQLERGGLRALLGQAIVAAHEKAKKLQGPLLE